VYIPTLLGLKLITFWWLIHMTARRIQPWYDADILQHGRQTHHDGRLEGNPTIGIFSYADDYPFTYVMYFIISGRGFERSLPHSSHVSRVSRRVDASPAKVVQTIPRPGLYKYGATFAYFLSFIPLSSALSPPYIKTSTTHRTSPSFMRFHQQKVSRTGYGTAFVGLRNPVVHFALAATGFLALQPAINGIASNDGLRPATIGNGAVTLAGRIKGVVHKVALPTPARKVARVRGPTKVHRRGPSSTATSSSTTSTGKTAIIAASLVSVGVGAALALGNSNAQGDSSAGDESPRNGGDPATGGDSGQNSFGEFHLFGSSLISDLAFPVGEGSPPPGDNPNDPSGAGNGAGMPHSFGFFGYGAHLFFNISGFPRLDDWLQAQRRRLSSSSSSTTTSGNQRG
jgi:hypothetical protein